MSATPPFSFGPGLTERATLGDTIRWLNKTLPKFAGAYSSHGHGWYDLANFGAAGNGTADDSDALETAVGTAVRAGGGTILIPPGRVRLTRAITMASAVTLRGLGIPPGGINKSANGYPTLLKDHAGDCLVWTGANGLTAGSGGGAEKLRIVQISGTPASTAGLGSAIRLTAVDGSHKPSWCRFKDLVIEEQNGITAPWYQAIYVDGSASNILDLYFDNVTSHTTGTTGGAGAVRLDGATQPWFSDCTFYDVGAVVSVGPGAATTYDAHFSHCQALTFALDRAQSACWIGGILSTVTDTANTSGDTLILPGRWSGTFTPAGGGAVGIMRYSSSKIVGGATGGFDFLRPMQIPNARHYAGVTVAGTASKQLIGLGTDDNVRVNAAADAIVVLGAAVSYSGLSNGDTQIGGRVRVTSEVLAPRYATTGATLAYSASMTADATTGHQTVTITDAVAHTYNAPLNPVTGEFLTFTIRNTSGGAAGAATWNAGFKMAAWTQPANGFSRSITFRYNGTNWVEISRTPADVPN